MMVALQADDKVRAQDGLEHDAILGAQTGSKITANIKLGATGMAVLDVQERLQSLGYDLGTELAETHFGELTAKAVAAFRALAQLPKGDEVDQGTWTALVDATFTFGDRLLYLRLPHFHGRDVHVLQTALAVLGFSCHPDGIFGLQTEHAVREFQQNAGINGDGIVGDATFSAINRLRHAWEGKDALRSELHSGGFARAAEVLEKRALCLMGTDELTASIASRIVNLALATTPASLVQQAGAVQPLDGDGDGGVGGDGSAGGVGGDAAGAAGDGNFALLIKLSQSGPSAGDLGVIPLVVFDNDSSINARMATAVGLTSPDQRRVMVHLAHPSLAQGQVAALEEQHIAIALLDALCSAFTGA